MFVWTDATRVYLAASGQFVERWRDDTWSHFQLTESDIRSVVTTTGSGRLGNLDFLGGDVELVDVVAADPVVIRANYYPAWRAYAGNSDVPLYESGGQLAFRAPRSGSYTVRLVYPRYRWLSVLALLAFAGGMIALWRISPPAR
jgi:hypothetical protein